MDSLTQVALGAAVGQAVLGKKVGNKAVLWGGVGGLIPDLDVLAAPFLSDVQQLTFHRGFSHSITFAVLFSPLLAYAVSRIHQKAGASWRNWTWLMFWSIFTHPILDCFTLYGTQLFQPFSTYPVALNTIFIVDPLYTAPLLITVIALMFFQRFHPKRQILNYAGLALSTGYLCLTAVNKLYVDSVFEKSLQGQNISYQRFFTNPTPLNNILWRGVAETEDGFFEGLYSLLDRDQLIDFRFIPKNHELIQPFVAHGELDELIWFTKGYFCVSQEDGLLFVNDLRFGKTDMGLLRVGDYLFSYRIDATGKTAEGIGVERVGVRVRISKELLRQLLRRARGV